MSTVLQRIYDHRRHDSLAAELRKKRLALFKSLLTSVPSSLKILDVGGTAAFWQQTELLEKENNLEITVININKERNKLEYPNIQYMVGDARNMKQFNDKEFDIVFSNSVIEHVGDYKSQKQMANEIMRVGKRYFVQTPNFYFPVEPHFVFPLFQFLPLDLRAWLLNHFNLGWTKKINDKQKVMEKVAEIRLLKKSEMIALFPNANFFEEKIFGLTKSLIVYDGWETELNPTIAGNAKHSNR